MPINRIRISDNQFTDVGTILKLRGSGGFDVDVANNKMSRVDTVLDQSGITERPDIDELLEAAKAVALADSDVERQKALRRSKLGSWLDRQKFTDWAGLAVNLARLGQSI